MPLPIVAAVPLVVGSLFSGAIYTVWRRRPEASHARTWSLAFALVAAGWTWNIVIAALVGPFTVPGAAPSLCWLAAGLLFVHGLRQRAKRADRSMVLAAIWAAIGTCDGLLFDLVLSQGPLLRGGIPILTAIGLALAAVAVGPRRRRAGSLDWIAAALLLAFAFGNVLLDLPLLATDPALTMAAVPLAASLVYVALGLAGMLLLSEDQTIALEKLARTDPLTRIWNRRAFNEAAPFLLERLRRSPEPNLAAVAITDIDAFKSINDRFGHATGDNVLVGFARLLNNAVDRGDILARLGGEEFALLAIGVDGHTLRDRVEQLRQMISMRSAADGALPSITASFGVAQLSPSTLELRDALERADRALYRAKELGRNRTVLAGTEDEAGNERAMGGAEQADPPTDSPP